MHFKVIENVINYDKINKHMIIFVLKFVKEETGLLEKYSPTIVALCDEFL